MSDLLIILLVFIILSIVAIVQIERAMQRAKEGKSIYTGRVLETRAKFLADVFDLRLEELKWLHFDGYLFHIANKPAYTELSSVSCVSAHHVVVVNSALPHTTSWRHERVIGGPDRRYSDNPMTMISRQLKLRFCGARDYTLTIYEYPYRNEIEGTLKKINTLFNTVTFVDLEANYKQYETAFVKAQHTQSLLDTVRARKSELDSILDASRRLLSQGIPADKLPAKRDEIVAEQDFLNTVITSLQSNMTAARNEAAFIVQTIRSAMSQQADFETVHSYQTGHPFRDSSSYRQRQQTEQAQKPLPKKPQAENPYDVLNVSPNATPDEITAAYRRMAQMYHPDKVATLAPEFRELAEERMKAINAAYQQLKRDSSG